MKLLKASDGKGYYLNEAREFALIDRITKEDLLRLVDLTLSDDVDFDEYDESVIQNQAHQILYKSVLEKLDGLKERKQEFTDESKRMYLKEYERYQEKQTPHDSDEA